jgi:two-component system, NtrC family, response regulator AtoC
MDVLEFAFESQSLKDLQAEVKSLSSVHNSVLVIGDSGTGKTTWSHVICRFDGVAQVIESHEAPKSVKAWKDISQNWDRNPIILEDIDKWSDVVQSSFAQFAKEQKRLFKRVVATSSTRLMAKVREGQFRSDVYYILAVRKIELPKLHECCQDFEKIVGFWTEVSGLMSGQSKIKVLEPAMQKISTHRWQGNFTELVNVLERAISLSKGEITEQQIQFDEWSHDYSELEAGLTLAEVEKKLIMQTLNLTAQNKSQAARMLGISIRTLRNKLNEYRQEVAHELI